MRGGIEHVIRAEGEFSDAEREDARVAVETFARSIAETLLYEMTRPTSTAAPNYRRYDFRSLVLTP